MIRTFLFLSLFFSPSLFAKDSRPGCSSELDLPVTTTLTLPIHGVNKPFLFHNAQVAESLKNGLSVASLTELVKRLLNRGTFDIPNNNGGFVAAANVGNHNGNYGRYFWFRDLARIYAGTSSLVKIRERLGRPTQAARATLRERGLALVKLLDDPWFEHQQSANIQNPGLHLDPSNAQQSSIWVRRLAAPFQENRRPTDEESRQESDWGHRQNDAIAAFALTILDAIAHGELSDADVSPHAHQNLIKLVDYFIALNYHQMWDMGAWEEELALRTSSVGLVTSFMEIASLLKHENGIDSLAMKGAIQDAYALLLDRYAIANGGPRRLIETDKGAFRNEDTAILHGLWWPLKRISDEQYIEIIHKLDVLKRDSGYARYKNDWFLYGPAAVAPFADQMGLVGKLTVVENGIRRVATLSEIEYLARLHADHKYDHRMDEVVALAGENLEPNWTMPDAFICGYLSDLHIKTKKAEYLEGAKEHCLRLFGLITGDTDISSEGAPMEPFRMPEAYLPVPLKIGDQIQTVYFTSPNSPLNWATAEFTVAVDKFLRALKASE